MATGDRVDPYRGYNFRLEIGGFVRAGFRECSGLDTSQDPIEYREGDEKPLTARKLTGLNKYSNVTLKWGLTADAGDQELWDWRERAKTGDVDRQDVSIVLNDDHGEEVWRWNLSHAWPTKWTGPSFNATGNEVAIETLEIAHEDLSKT